MCVKGTNKPNGDCVVLPNPVFPSQIFSQTGWIKRKTDDNHPQGSHGITVHITRATIENSLGLNLEVAPQLRS